MEKRKIKLEEDGQLSNFDLRYANHERELEIDKDSLDDNLIAQPGNHAKVAEAYAELISLRDGMKDRVKQIEAELFIHWRQHLAHTGERPTEKLIEAHVDADPRRAKAMRRYLGYVREAARWEGLKDAFKDRGFVLRGLAEMWADGYFGDNVVRGKSVQQVHEAARLQRRAEMHEARIKARKERNR